MDFRSIKLNDTPLIASDDVTFEDVSQSDIAIIGISLKLPMADTVEQFADNLRTGLDCVRPIPLSRRKDTDRYFRWIGKKAEDIPYGEAAFLDEIDKFDYRFFKLSPKEASLLDPNQRLFLQTAWSAIEDAGYNGEKLKMSRTGVYVGYGSDSDYKKMIQDIEPENIALAMTGNVRSIIASRLSYLLDLRGPSLLVDTTCSSSLVAVHLACQAIRNGECDMAIAGGIQLHLVPVREAEVGIESSTSRARTFDDSSDGTGTGEGVVAIVLKTLEQAREDRDSIYAVIKSSAMNQDGSSVGITAPNAEAQEAVIVEAWKKADIDPGTIDYIEAHGTGTKLGDPIEIEAIQRAFRRFTDKRQFCAVASLKSNLGHLDNTAGIAGLVKAALSLHEKRIYPSLHFERPNREIDFANSPVYVSDRLIDWEREDGPRRCGVSSFGMSGTNCHVVLEEAPEYGIPSSIAASGPPKLLVWSAQSESALHELVRNFGEYFQRNQQLDLEDVSYTLSVGRGHYKHRIALLASSIGEAARRLDQVEEFIQLKQSKQQGLLGDAESFEWLLTAATASAEVEAGEESNRLQSIDQLLKRWRSAAEPDAELLRELGAAYIRGAAIPWETLYAGKKRRRVHLPTYAFERDRCWLSIPETEPAIEAQESGKSRLYHQRIWIQQSLTAEPATNLPQTMLVFKEDGDAGTQLASISRNAGCHVIEVGIGNGYEQVSESAYRIKDDYSDYDRLFRELESKKVDRIVYLRSLGDRTNTETLSDLDERLHRSVYGLFFLAKALANTGFGRVEVIVATLLADEVYPSDQERVIPESYAMIGLGKVIGWENPNVRLRCIDLDEATDAAATLWTELTARSDGSYMTAYRMGVRYVDQIHPLELGDGSDSQKSQDLLKSPRLQDSPGSPNPPKPLESPDSRNLLDLPKSAINPSKDGIYLITGGFGGIGLHIAKHLASSGTIRLGLIGRSGMPPREKWDAIIRERSDDRLAARIEAILEIERMGSQVIAIQADVADGSQLAEAIAAIRRQYGRIAGVIHAAGVSEGNLIGSLTLKEFKAVTASKIQGTWLLDRLTRQDDPDFFVMFSSAITLVGGFGSGPYTAGNAYLDAYSAYRSRHGRRTLVLNWPAWDGTGMAAGAEMDESKEMFRLLRPAEGVEAFRQALASDCKQVYVGEWNAQSDLFALGELLPFRMAEPIRPVARPEQLDPAKNRKNTERVAPIRLKGKTDGGYSEIEQRIAQAWKQVLGYDELDIHANFFEIGGDSILITKIHALIEEQYPKRTTVADMFSYPTIARISEYLSNMSSTEEQWVAEAGKTDQFDQEILRLFDRLGKGELSIDDAVGVYHTLEAVNG